MVFLISLLIGPSLELRHSADCLLPLQLMEIEYGGVHPGALHERGVDQGFLVCSVHLNRDGHRGVSLRIFNQGGISLIKV